MPEINEQMANPNDKAQRIKEKLQRQPAIIAVSGPSGAGKDYLTQEALKYFESKGIACLNVQMTTERPHRGDVETKVCISPEEYTQLQRKGALIGDHLNKVRYGYNIHHLQTAIDQAREEGGLVILELNPAKQRDFPVELQQKLGISLTAWIGVKTTLEQTRDNMRERSESKETIESRLAQIEEFVNAMAENPNIKLVDNGPNNRTNSASDFITIIEDSILEQKE